MPAEVRTLNRWQKCRLAFAHGCVYLLSLLPMWMLYLLSDLTFIFLYSIGRYRRKIVRKNLRESFPEKSKLELLQIEVKFYHWLCDYIFETIKLASMSRKQMQRRMRFENTELPNRLLTEGRSIALMLGHYCNWEWVSSIPLHINVPNSKLLQIYHPIENAVVNKLFLHIRERMDATSVPMLETLRVIMHHKLEGNATMTGFIADQAPNWHDIHCWIPFMSHPETPFFTGSERIAKKLDFVVLYLDVRREKRGYYVATYRMMTEHPKEYKDWEITEWYARLLEESIRRQPHLWLWSHNRWKRTREQYNELIDPETGKLRI